MSAASAERGGITAGALVGIALGLMLLAALAAWLLAGRAGPVDGRAQLQEAFGTSTLAFGLEVVQASALSGGEVSVVCEVPGAPPEPPRAVQPETPAEEGPTAPRFDWSTVPIPAPSAPPRQAAFLFVSGARGGMLLDEMVRGVRGRDRKELDREGGTVVVARGTIGFRGYDSDWVHLRAYEAGGTFRDAMRVSLSTQERICVLTASWPRGSAASEAQLLELITPLGARAK